MLEEFEIEKYWFNQLGLFSIWPSHDLSVMGEPPMNLINFTGNISTSILRFSKHDVVPAKISTSTYDGELEHSMTFNQCHR